MAVAADGSIKPYLAETMSPNSTYDTWTMTLRSGVTFHDGSALTSAVVKANFAALASSALAGQALKQIRSVTTPDGLTVVFDAGGPQPHVPRRPGRHPGGLRGRPGHDRCGEQQFRARPPSRWAPGPSSTADWQPNSHFTVVRNPNYWRKGLPYLDGITFKPIPDTSQREATLRSGGVDMIESIDPSTISNFSGSGGSGYQLVDTRTGVIGQPSFSFIMLNTAVAPTDDLTIRQALAKAIDQKEVQAVIGGPPAQPATGIFLPDSPYYSNTGYPTYDLSGAKSLVAAYKAKHGTPTLNLLTIPDPLAIKEVQAVQQMWQQAGFDVTVSEVEQATIIDDFVLGKFQAVTSYQFGAVNPDLNYVWWSTTTISPVGAIGLNFTRVDDPVIEEAMLIGRSTTDQATRVAAYRTVNEQLAKQLPYLWIEQYSFSEVAAERVQNFANPTLPDGSAGYPFDEGRFWPTQIWLA